MTVMDNFKRLWVVAKGCERRKNAGMRVHACVLTLVKALTRIDDEGESDVGTCL